MGSLLITSVSYWISYCRSENIPFKCLFLSLLFLFFISCFIIHASGESEYLLQYWFIMLTSLNIIKLQDNTYISCKCTQMQSHMAYTSNMINVQAWGEAINECKIPNVQETKKHKTTQLLLFFFFFLLLSRTQNYLCNHFLPPVTQSNWLLLFNTDTSCGYYEMRLNKTQISKSSYIKLTWKEGCENKSGTF